MSPGRVATVVATQPANAHNFGIMSSMGTIPEDAVDDPSFDNGTQQRRPSLPLVSRSTPPSSQRPRIPASRSIDSLPLNLKRPKKLSNGASPTRVSNHGSDHTGLTRSASWESTLTSKLGDGIVPRRKYPSMPSSTRREQEKRWAKPNQLFAALPPEVLELILAKLKLLHVGRGQDSCATCWMRDLCSISLCSHRWSTLARMALYEDIQLLGSDSAAHKKRYKLAQGSRIVMLRHTLRANPHLAAIVRSLKVPRFEISTNEASTKKSMSKDQYDDIVASLVMACPNLEQLYGPICSYDHAFRRIYHALSTRRQISHMEWLIEGIAPEKIRRTNSSSRAGSPENEDLHPHQQEAFLELHDQWCLLTSLSIRCTAGASLAPDTLLIRTIDQLPSLQHLYLSNLAPNAFNDSNLLSLPRLHTLSLAHISGVTTTGLSTFAAGPNSMTLRNLQLRHTPLSDISALAQVLSNLKKLATFALVQAFPPLVSEGESPGLWKMPYVTSASLRKLHWDITSYSDSLHAVDETVSRSIAAGGFPALRTLRVLNDAEGVFQNLCRPMIRADLPSDRFASPLIARANTEPIMLKSSKKLLWKTPTELSSSPSSHRFDQPPPFTSLCTARLAAQARIEMAAKKSRCDVNVIGPEGDVVETFGIGGYIGTAGSPIAYHLHADANSSDERGGLLDLRDLCEERADTLSTSRLGCTGSWNRCDEVTMDKKEKEKWWHTERGRWSKIEMR